MAGIISILSPLFWPIMYYSTIITAVDSQLAQSLTHFSQVDRLQVVIPWQRKAEYMPGQFALLGANIEKVFAFL